MVKVIDQIPDIAGIELNVSYPNVHAGGIEFGRDPKVLKKLVTAVRQNTKKSLWIKLSPNVTDIIPLALAAEEAGADALTVMNTLIGLRIDIEKQKPIRRQGGRRPTGRARLSWADACPGHML